MRRVLIVDDSKFMAKVIKKMLEGMDFDVVALGRDGQQGLDLFDQHRPEVTLLDVTMPNMCGVECLAGIKAIDPEANVIMHSAIQDQEVIDKCLEIGAASFLQKPIRKDNQEDLMRMKEALQNAGTNRS